MQGCQPLRLMMVREVELESGPIYLAGLLLVVLVLVLPVGLPVGLEEAAAAVDGASGTAVELPDG